MKKVPRTESRVAEKVTTVIRPGDLIPLREVPKAFRDAAGMLKEKIGGKTSMQVQRELRYGASTKRKSRTDSSVSEKGATIIRYDKGEPIPPTPLSPVFYELTQTWKGKLDKTPLALARELRYGR